MIALTDLTPISNLRQFVETAIAEELASLHAGLATAVRDWHLTSPSISSAALARRLRDFEPFVPPSATKAYGDVTVIVTAPATIQAGTRFQTEDGRAYRAMLNSATADGSWPITGFGDVAVEAEFAGSAGNAATGSIVLGAGVPNLDSVSNAAPLTNGTDAPSNEEVVQAFHDYLLSLSGGTAGAIQYAVTRYVDPDTGRRVRSVAIEEATATGAVADEAGNWVSMRVWLDEGLSATTQGDATADSQLVERIRALIDGDGTENQPGLRSAGCPASIQAAKAWIVPVEIAAEVRRGANLPRLRNDLRDAHLRFFAQLPVAGPPVSGTRSGQFYLAELLRALVDVPGVLRVTPIRPLQDLAIAPGYKAVGGEFVATSLVEVGA